MYRRYDKTSIGGDKEAFQTTCWTEIQSISEYSIPQRRQIITNLTNRYWKPVYCYLRRKGYSNESAKDLTQGFFQEIVLENDLLQRADQAKGRFRTFLLTALDRYVSNSFRKDKAQKRFPVEGLSSLTDENIDNIAAPAEFGPEQMFHYAWASDLLDSVLHKVRDDCFATGKETHWKIFDLKVLSPIIHETEDISIKQICQIHGIDNEQQVSNMIVTVKRIFKTELKNQLRSWIQSDREINDEFNELIKALTIGGAI